MTPEEEELNEKIWNELVQESSNFRTKLRGYRYTSFVSKSNGRNKRRRKWREVEFIGLPGGRIVSVINGRFPRTKKTRMDSVAEEAVGDICPPHIHPLDYFLCLLREREKSSKK